jgi:penicillin-binding protein 1B
MAGLSRSATRIRNALLLAFAIPMHVLLLAGSAYLFTMHRRMTRDLLDRQWRAATTIVSAVTEGEVGRFYGRDWSVTPPVHLEEIPRFVGDAFLAAEDVRFRHHPGIDPIGIGRALFTNVRQGGIAQGGSTINQQLIKSKYLSQERTYRRKLAELALAVALDFRMSKDDILEAYLNDVYLGHYRGRPVLGVDEAARTFFNKRPADLRVEEAALLAGIVRAPNRDTPDKRPELARARRDAILGVMRERDWITEEEHDRAVRRGVSLSYGKLKQQPHSFYVAALRRELARELGQGVLTRAGLTITAEIDPRMQRAAEDAAQSGVRALGRYSWIRRASEPVQVAIFSMDPESGGVRAVVGGSNPDAAGFDRTIRMKRQPGSAFKPFVFLAAIETRRYTAASLLVDAPLRVELARGRNWEPHNYDEKFRGRVTVREALEESLNVPTVRMAQDLGLGRVVRTVDDFGFEGEFRRIPALPLGVSEVTVRELTAAYTAFATLGTRAEPYLVREVKDAKGAVIHRREPKREKVIDAPSAYVLHTMLRGVVRRGTASRLRRYGLGHVAGKTGTTSAYRDAWFVGYTPDVVTTVWVGFDRGSPLRLSSAEAALPIWGSYMREVKTSREELKRPDEIVVRQIDPETGYLWAEGCPGPQREYFIKGTEPKRRCPRGFFGRIARRVLFDAENFDEPPAITFDKFRRWSEEVDQGRERVDSRLEKLRRSLFGRREE